MELESTIRELRQVIKINYEPPAVIYEAALEVRAGSPLGMPDPLNLEVK